MRALLLDAFNKDVRVVDPQNLQDYLNISIVMYFMCRLSKC